MDKKKFKVGDRVRYTCEEGPWLERQLYEGDEGVIVGKAYDDDEAMCVRFNVNEDICIDELEIVDSTDDKDAFLKELQALLDKYNASIYADFDQSDEVYTTTIAVGEDSVKYLYTCGIDSDNIMDYDK